jgi:hypothetical protein
VTETNAALLAAALLFFLFIATQALLPALAGRKARRAAHSQISNAVARGSDEKRPAPERAAAYREASELALIELHRPRLAVRYALWADKAAPNEAATISLVARAMTRAKKHRALERYLWKALDAAPAGEAHAAAFDALIALYEGPLHGPERARVLRALASRPPA